MTAEDPKRGQEDVTTVRTVLNMLTQIAADLPEGLDSRVEVGVCDGENVQLMDQVDVDVYTHFAVSAGQEAGEPFVILRAHHHPGKAPGMLLRGVASAADAELRKLTDEESE